MFSYWEARIVIFLTSARPCHWSECYSSIIPITCSFALSSFYTAKLVRVSTYWLEFFFAGSYKDNYTSAALFVNTEIKPLRMLTVVIVSVAYRRA